MRIDDPSSSVRLAVAGMGGFARAITDLVQRHAAAGHGSPGYRLVAVGDPAAAHPDMADRRASLEASGVRVFEDFSDVLSIDEVEAVWLPVPIPLHRPFTEAAYKAGKHVICEKPLAVGLADVDAMIRARDAAGRLGMVGFHDMFHDQTHAIKRDILAGALGDLEGVTVIASWPRGSVYFGRSSWAGRKTCDGAAVSDSPANNALAHFLMLGLHFLGETPTGAATPVHVEASTLRAAPIENYDTINARFTTAGGRALRLLLTHASTELLQPQIYLHGTSETWAWTLDGKVPLVRRADRRFSQPADTRASMMYRVARVVRGVARPDEPWASFEAARAQVAAIALVDAATEPRSFPADRVHPRVAGPEVGTVYHVRGLMDEFKRAARQPIGSCVPV